MASEWRWKDESESEFGKSDDEQKQPIFETTSLISDIDESEMTEVFGKRRDVPYEEQANMTFQATFASDKNPLKKDFKRARSLVQYVRFSPATMYTDESKGRILRQVLINSDARWQLEFQKEEVQQSLRQDAKDGLIEDDTDAALRLLVDVPELAAPAPDFVDPQKFDKELKHVLDTYRVSTGSRESSNRKAMGRWIRLWQSSRPLQQRCHFIIQHPNFNFQRLPRKLSASRNGDNKRKLSLLIKCLKRLRDLAVMQSESNVEHRRESLRSTRWFDRRSLVMDEFDATDGKEDRFRAKVVNRCDVHKIQSEPGVRVLPYDGLVYLTKRHKPIAEEMKTVWGIWDLHGLALSRAVAWRPDVTGISAGFRIRGDVETSEVCLIVYVRIKGAWPVGLGPIDATLAGTSVPIDIQETRFRSCMDTEQKQARRSHYIGSRILANDEHGDERQGTLGCFLRDQQGKEYTFTCAHVVRNRPYFRGLDATVDLSLFGPLDPDRLELHEAARGDLEEQEDVMRTVDPNDAFADFALLALGPTANPRQSLDPKYLEHYKVISEARKEREIKAGDFVVTQTSVAAVDKRIDRNCTKRFYGFGATACAGNDWLRFAPILFPAAVWVAFSDMPDDTLYATGVLRCGHLRAKSFDGDSGTAVWIDTASPEEKDYPLKHNPQLFGVLFASNDARNETSAEIICPLGPIFDHLATKGRRLTVVPTVARSSSTSSAPILSDTPMKILPD